MRVRLGVKTRESLLQNIKELKDRNQYSIEEETGKMTRRKASEDNQIEIMKGSARTCTDS